MPEESKMRLADELSNPYRNPEVQEIAQALRLGVFDEFGDGEKATPLMDLARELQEAGLRDFAQRVMDGEFDASEEDSKRWIEQQTGEISEIADLLGLRD